MENNDIRNDMDWGDDETDYDMSLGFDEFIDSQSSISGRIMQAVRKAKMKHSNEEIEETLGAVSKYQQWEVSSKGIYKAIGKVVTHEILPAGYYSLRADNKGNIFVTSKTFIFDDYIDLPIKEFKEILSDINQFWDIEDKFKEYGFVFKRGILIHGKQGLGKSFLINGVIKDLIEKRNGIVFSLYNSYDLNIFHQFFREQFRVIEPDRPVVVVIEDIDGLCKNPDTETELINLLDGVEHSSNVVYLATTNHIDRLEERIANRPSRFDKRYHIKAPDSEVRKVFIENKLKDDDLKNIDINEWVEKTDGFNLAHIKELIISVIIYGNTLDYALEHLNTMRERPKTDGEYSDNVKKFGF